MASSLTSTENSVYPTTNRKGIALIIDNLGNHTPRRDMASIETILTHLGFDYNGNIYRKQNTTKITDICKDFSNQLKNKANVYDSLICIILAYAVENKFAALDEGEADDQLIDTSQIFKDFHKCRALIDKPKIFLFQGFEKNQTMIERRVDKTSYGTGYDLTDPVNPLSRISFEVPFYEDFLIVYSVILGNKLTDEYVNTKGSSFFNCLLTKINECRVDDAHLEMFDFLTRSIREIMLEPKQKKETLGFISILRKILRIPITNVVTAT